MTTRPYELLVCFASNGLIRGASVRYITTVNGRDFEGDPIPLQGVEDPDFAAFAEQFSAAAIADRDQARAELATMTAERDSLSSSLAAMTAARDKALQDSEDNYAAFQSVNAALELKTGDLDTAQAALRLAESQRDEAENARDSLAAQLQQAKEQLAIKESELTARAQTIAQLQSQLPWDPRIIDASSFLARISQAELLDLTTSTDPTRLQIGQMLAAYRANDWPIMLDSTEMLQAVGYLQQSSAISAERAAELLRDSTREEAYKAGE